MKVQAENSEVVVLHLSQLIDRIGDGRLHIPRFQRRLVWEWDRKRELLRSVRDGIPMGSVMIWRTSNEHVAMRTSLAGHRLPPPRPNVPREYLLDGLQRLSTLYTAFLGPGSMDTDAEGGPRVGYDLREEEFVEMDVSTSEDGVIPLDVLGSAVTLLKAQRRWSGPEAEAWLERSDELARAFREYQVPVVTVVSNDVELATRTFKMINSQGQRMDEADMVHALAWGEGLEIRERIQALRDEFLAPVGWESLDDETVLRVVKADASIDLYDRSAEAVSLRVKEDPTRLDSVVRRLAQAAELLGELGVRSWSLVPYGIQPVLVAAALDGVHPDDAIKSTIRDWFWLTTYGEMFAGMSGSRLAQTLSDLRLAIQDGRVRWSSAKPLQLRGLPRAADFRSVLIKALALLLANVQRDVAMTPGDPFEVLAAYGGQALVSLLTLRQASRAICSSPANRFLCPPSELVELRRRILEGDIDSAFASAHLIDPEAIDSAKNGDWDRFVKIRSAHIWARESTLVEALRRKHGIGR
jgi:Protein of unknown function DUF262